MHYILSIKALRRPNNALKKAAVPAHHAPKFELVRKAYILAPTTIYGVQKQIHKETLCYNSFDALITSESPNADTTTAKPTIIIFMTKVERSVPPVLPVVSGCGSVIMTTSCC